MTAKQIMTELKAMGDEKIKKLLLKHGVKEPFFGVKVGLLKPIQKKIKKDYGISKELYATGNADAMYLAGLIADDEKMTKADLQTWVKQAVSNNISEYTVPWVAAEGQHGFVLAKDWIDSKEEYIAAAGWATLSNLVALKPDEELDIPALKTLLKRIEKDIARSPDRVRSTMNMFLISAGSYVDGLADEVQKTAKKIGVITIIKEGTACKTPDAQQYIAKNRKGGVAAKKKKTVKC